MRSVNTVLGSVPVNELGRTLMHEHLITAAQGWELDGRTTVDWERDVASVSAEVGALREHGVTTLVDATASGGGRRLEIIAEVARRSGINVIVCTGLMKDSTIPMYFRFRGIDDIADWMVWELTEGIARTGIRAGAIKVATSLGRVGKHEEKAIRAAARAQKRTGAPILTHTEEGTMGREQVDILESEGADLSRVIIGHSCGNGDLRYHFDILKRGANLGIDRVGMLSQMPDEVRRGIVISATAAGYASQIALSQDIAAAIYGGVPPEWQQGAYRPPERTYTYLFTNFIPKLREAGISERTVETMLVDLPRRVFGG